MVITQKRLELAIFWAHFLPKRVLLFDFTSVYIERIFRKKCFLADPIFKMVCGENNFFLDFKFEALLRIQIEYCFRKMPHMVTGVKTVTVFLAPKNAGNSYHKWKRYNLLYKSAEKHISITLQLQFFIILFFYVNIDYTTQGLCTHQDSTRFTHR